tara:strand:- start:318 stop:533 length:216 start_codon:yes stop_codon:yes gene_type:complete
MNELLDQTRARFYVAWVDDSRRDEDGVIVALHDGYVFTDGLMPSQIRSFFNAQHALEGTAAAYVATTTEAP